MKVHLGCLNGTTDSTAHLSPIMSWCMPPTVKNKQIINVFEKMVDLLYYEREETTKVGSFQGNQEAEPLLMQPKAKKKKLNSKEPNPSSSEEVVTPARFEKDIRSFFQKKKVVMSKVVTSLREDKKTSDLIIELSDSD